MKKTAMERKVEAAVAAAEVVHGLRLRLGLRFRESDGGIRGSSK
jgi:hypothetical protein